MSVALTELMSIFTSIKASYFIHILGPCLRGIASYFLDEGCGFGSHWLIELFFVSSFWQHDKTRCWILPLTRNFLKIGWERRTEFSALGSLCLNCCMRDTVWSTKSTLLQKQKTRMLLLGRCYIIEYNMINNKYWKYIIIYTYFLTVHIKH